MQVALLRAHSAEHLILGAARRSLAYNNLILLGKTDEACCWLIVSMVSIMPTQPNISEMNGLIYDCGTGNDFVIPLRGAEIEMSRVAFQIQDELVKPLREMDITNKEFVCLRAIVFFAPGQSVCKSVTCDKLLFLFPSSSSSVIPDKIRTLPGFFNFMFLSWACLFVLYVSLGRLVRLHHISVKPPNNMMVRYNPGSQGEVAAC